MQGRLNAMADDWMARCQRLVPQILRQRDWQLVFGDNLAGFIELVCQAIVDGTVRPRPGASPEAIVRRATIHLYCHELYRASGENGTLRQRRAFEEIGQHAQGVAFRYEQSSAIVQVCAQRALIIVWEKRKQVRQPGSFLRWIEAVVYHEIKGYWKEKHRRYEVPMSRFATTDGDEKTGGSLQRFWATLACISPPDDEVISQELRKQVWSNVRRVLADNPRYEAVIVGYYRYELSLPELTELLDTPVRNVYVLKSRALARLRADEAFVQRFANLIGMGRGEES
jgi:RNA polymerase sigma factor (sigma-70 family)